MHIRFSASRLSAALLLGCCLLLSPGCGDAKTEKPADGKLIDIDIKTPIGDVKVDQDPETGRAKVDVDAGGVKVDVGANE